MPPNPVRILLPTGDPVLLRPVAPDDRDRLREALERTSSRTRSARFGRHRTAFTEAELDYFTRVDQLDHVAWCAVAGWIPGEPGIGSARYVRDPERPDTAEMAVTVLDDYQGMGVGTAP
jgi:RimJ/RimL family protein N-acetyltransferase